MRIATWQTNHIISRTVHDAMMTGLPNAISCDVCDGMDIKAVGDINIGYGILRGMDKVFQACNKAGKPWFHIDRGYWKPGHFDGYYRVSLNGTQQTTGLNKIEPDYDRWDALGIEILSATERDERTLVCPPTEHVSSFFGLNWEMPFVTENIIYRNKQFQHIPLQNHLDFSNKVIIFNSSVGWEALRQGIPVISDQKHSILGAYQKLVDKPLHLDSNERRKLFAIQASLQLTLSEMKEGLLWPLLQNLLMCSSGGTHAKP